ncbi:ATP-dependent Clp protease adaptor ClpS [Aeoliella sp. SH292]|uniref:ATP-dependent Clp protease adaptor ClpS n=1 Tax=Aeoliella sp. SH292 TaxID=3454464 RepID=UPI003F9652D9
MDEMHFDGPDDPDDGGTSTVVAPKKQQKAESTGREVPKYHVILWDSDDHTFDYVEKMLRELFGHTKKDCEEIAKNVDKDGRAIVLTTTKEHAELKRDQIHAYGKDNLEASKGSMWATIESAD